MAQRAAGYSYLYIIIRVPGINSDTPTLTVRPRSIDFGHTHTPNSSWEGPVGGRLPLAPLGVLQQLTRYFAIAFGVRDRFWSSFSILGPPAS